MYHKASDTRRMIVFKAKKQGELLTCRLPLFFIILVSGFVGGLIVMALREAEYRILTKRNCYYQPDSDPVVEIRNHGKKLLAELRSKVSE